MEERSEVVVGESGSANPRRVDEDQAAIVGGKFDQTVDEDGRAIGREEMKVFLRCGRRNEPLEERYADAGGRYNWVWGRWCGRIESF